MSEKKSDKPDQSETNKDQSDKTIILEAEVIEDAAPKTAPKSDTQSDKAEKTTRSQAQKNITPNKSSGTTSSNGWGWRVALLLIVFVAGMVSFPWAERGLMWLGLVDTGLASKTYYTKEDAKDYQVFLQNQINLISDQTVKLEQTIDGLNKQAITPPTDRAAVQELKTSVEAVKADLRRLSASVNTIQSSQTSGQTGGSGVTAAEFQTITNLLTTQQNEISRLKQLLETLSLSDSKGTLALADKVTQLEGALALSKNENTQLSERLQQIEQSLSTLSVSTLQSSPRGRLVMRLTSIQAMMQNGDDISAALQSLRPDIELLSTKDQVESFTLIKDMTNMGTDAATLADLQASYAAMASAVKKSEGEKEKSLFSGWFTARKKGEKAEGVDKTLFQAETALNSGNLNRAVILLQEELPDTLKPAAADWLSKATHKQKLSASLDTFIRLVSEQKGE